MTNQNVTLQLKTAYEDFIKLILSLSDDQFLSPMNGWSPRDVVAHLVGWNSLMIESSLSILAGNPPAYYIDKPNDFSNINATFTAKHASRSKQEILAELKSSMENLKFFIDSLPAKELIADHGVSHYSGCPATVIKIVDSLAGDYRYHTDQIKNLLHK